MENEKERGLTGLLVTTHSSRTGTPWAASATPTAMDAPCHVTSAGEADNRSIEDPTKMSNVEHQRTRTGSGRGRAIGRASASHQRPRALMSVKLKGRGAEDASSV